MAVAGSEAGGLLVQQGREGLVDEEAEGHIDHALAEGEGHVEDQQALPQAVRRGQDGLVHPHDGLERHLIEHHIGGIDHKVVQGQGDHGHQRGARDRAHKGALPGLVAAEALIDEARREGEHGPGDKVEHLAHVGGGGAVDQGEEQVFEEGHGHAVDRSQGKCGQQLRQVGDVHLHEGGDQRRDGELDEHQQEGDGAEHGGDGEFVGLFCGRHKKYAPFPVFEHPGSFDFSKVKTAKERAQKTRGFAAPHLLPSRL